MEKSAKQGNEIVFNMRKQMTWKFSKEFKLNINQSTLLKRPAKTSSRPGGQLIGDTPNKITNKLSHRNLLSTRLGTTNDFHFSVLLSSGNPRTLFRGNSLAAKCMEQFMKV